MSGGGAGGEAPSVASSLPAFYSTLLGSPRRNGERKREKERERERKDRWASRDKNADGHQSPAPAPALRSALAISRRRRILTRATSPPAVALQPRRDLATLIAAPIGRSESRSSGTPRATTSILRCTSAIGLRLPSPPSLSLFRLAPPRLPLPFFFRIETLARLFSIPPVHRSRSAFASAKVSSAISTARSHSESSLPPRELRTFLRCDHLGARWFRKTRDR